MFLGFLFFLAEVFRVTIARFGGLDVVVNNAGVLFENESWRTAIMVNTVRLLYTTYFLFHSYS